MTGRTEPGDDVTDDAILGGRLRLLQPRKGHRFGHDAILLAAAVPARPGERVADLGAGVGAAGLALAKRVPGVSISLIERESMLAALARENVARNGFAESIGVIASDVTALATAGHSDITRGAFDRILMNPPFNDGTRHQASRDRLRRNAHVAEPATLAGWLNAAAWLLADHGSVTLIARAENLDDVIKTLGRDFRDIVVLRVSPKPDATPIRVVVHGVRTKPQSADLSDASQPVFVTDLVLNDESGRPSEAAERVLRYAAPLNLSAGR